MMRSEVKLLFEGCIMVDTGPQSWVGFVTQSWPYLLVS
jgi:hypothetical protein